MDPKMQENDHQIRTATPAAEEELRIVPSNIAPPTRPLPASLFTDGGDVMMKMASLLALNSNNVSRDGGLSRGLSKESMTTTPTASQSVSLGTTRFDLGATPPPALLKFGDAVAKDVFDSNGRGGDSSPPPSNGDELAAAPAYLKWYILVLTCVLLFGTDYCYDLPGAFGAGDGATIQTYFTANGKTYNQKMNQSLYAIYSYPNMVMTIAGGLLIDQYLGLRKTTLFFSSLTVLASTLFAFGVWSTHYPSMVVGRLLLGCSGENLFVAQSAFVSKWFGGGSNMALAFGIAVSFPRLGGGFAYILSPISAASALGVPFAAVVGLLIVGLSFAGTVLLIIVDARAEKKGFIKASPVVAGGGHGGGSHSAPSNSDAQIESGTTPSLPSSPAHGDGPFSLSNIPTLPKTLWLLALTSLLCDGATFPFVGIAKTYFERTYSVSGSSASFTTSLFHLLSALMSPAVGLVVDKVGKGPFWLVVASSGLAATFAFLVGFPSAIAPLLLMIVLSAFYSTFIAGVWSFSSLTVPEKANGFAFGVMIAATNFGLATSPLIVGSILDANTNAMLSDEASMVSDADLSEDGEGNLLPSARGFSLVLSYLLCVALAAIAVSFALWRCDSQEGRAIKALGDGGAKGGNPDGTP